MFLVVEKFLIHEENVEKDVIISFRKHEKQGKCALRWGKQEKESQIILNFPHS